MYNTIHKVYETNVKYSSPRLRKHHQHNSSAPLYPCTSVTPRTTYTI